MDAPADVQHVEVAGASAPSYDNAVQLDLGLAVVSLAYERMLAKRIAIQGEVGLFGTWFGSAFEQPNLNGFGIGARPTFFLTDDGPRGVYVAPFIRLDHVKTSEAGAASTWGYSTGGFLGYAWVFADRFNLRLGAGAQWFAYDVHVGPKDEAFRSFFPAVDIVVGYAF